MSFNWRFCLKVGVLVALVDLATLGLAQLRPSDELRSVLDLLNLIVNVMLFSRVGFRTGLETGRATTAAEAGVVTSLLPALAAALYPVLLPAWIDPASAEIPLYRQIVSVIAWNIVIGGLSALLSGFLASRGRTPVR
jgi:hypothetical protein